MQVTFEGNEFVVTGLATADGHPLTFKFGKESLDRTNRRNTPSHEIKAYLPGGEDEWFKLGAWPDEIGDAGFAQRVAEWAPTTVPCTKCGKLRFTEHCGMLSRTRHGMDREVGVAGTCVECFCAALRDDDAEQRARDDAKHKAKGYTHAVDAWKHMAHGGDDVMVTLYSKGVPSEAVIAKTLKRSVVKNDYTIRTL